MTVGSYIKQNSDGGSDGTKIGQSATDKIGFYGATPIVQPAGIADATDAASVITRCNLVITALETLGLLTTV
jgi:hypothetical protein